MSSSQALSLETFTELADSPETLFDKVAQQLAATEQWHRLFDLRLMQRRHQLGLPLERSGTLEDADEAVRDDLEAGYVAACREVGQLLLEKDQLREAWMYLRPAGEKQLVREYLSSVVANEENCDALIEISLHEGVDPERGYAWLIAHHGTCNSITTLDSLAGQLDEESQQACAAILLRHVYAELQGNLRGHLHRLEGTAPEGMAIGELIEQFPALTEGGSYHLDASHLASTVRFSRLLTEPALVQKALEICDYGKRLIEDLQYPGEAPFENLYPTHELFLKATLGEAVDEAVEFFTKRAREEHAAEPTLGVPTNTAVETLLVLLARNDRHSDAMEIYAELVPPERGLSSLAPTLLELASVSGNWQRYEELCHERDDLVGYTAGRAMQTRKLK
ncbi:MAG: hypothetical protein RH917_18950 [Lacipirellulaceae bacterium]